MIRHSEKVDDIGNDRKRLNVHSNAGMEGSSSTVDLCTIDELEYVAGCWCCCCCSSLLL